MTTGEYNVIRFSGVVSGTDISIVGVQMTLNSVTCTSHLYIWPVHAAGNVAGKNAAGSTFNVSSMRITGSASSTGGQVILRTVKVGRLVQFEQVECSGNDFSGVALTSATSNAQVLLFFAPSRTCVLFLPHCRSRSTSRWSAP